MTPHTPLSRRLAPHFSFAIGLLLLFSIVTTTASGANVNPEVYDFSPPAGPNHTVVGGTVKIRDHNGKLVDHPTHYTEVATGLNYLEDGKWNRSEEGIAPHPDGASAQKGQYKVIFNRELRHPAAITLIGSDGQVLHNHPSGIFYVDRQTGAWIKLSDMSASLGYIAPPNKVIYTNIFVSIKADLRYTYQMGRFEADVILREQPPAPSTFGLSDETTVLELLTEFEATREPTVSTRILREETDAAKRLSMVEADIADDTLRFGTLTMILGQAFSGDRESDDRAAVLIFKRWRADSSRRFLSEQLEYRSLSPLLTKLPVASIGARSASQLQRTWPPFTPQPKSSVGKMPIGQDLAGGGVVLDYVITPSSAVGYTFAANTTYLLAGSLTINPNGSCYFQNPTYIKYCQNSSILICNDVTISGSGATLTTKDDDSIGQIILDSSHYPGISAFAALWLYYPNYNHSIHGLDIRYAASGIRIAANPGNVRNHVLTDIHFADSDKGIYIEAGSPHVDANSMTFCRVSSPTSGGDIDLVNTQDCAEPTISAIPDQVRSEDEVFDLTVTVGDPQSTASDLQVTLDGWGDQMVWFDRDLSGEINAQGAQRVVRFTTWKDMSGPGIWWVTVTDPQGHSTSSRFHITLTPVNDDPVVEIAGPIGTITDKQTPAAAVVITDPDPDETFTVLDRTWDSAYVDDVQVTGAGNVRFLTVTPKPGAIVDSTTVTVTVADSTGAEGSASVSLAIKPDPANPDGGTWGFAPPGSLGAPSARLFGPCPLPDFEQFIGSVTVPGTCDNYPPDLDPPNSSGTLSRGYSLPFYGSADCEYLLRLTVTGHIRPTRNPKGSGPYISYYDLVSAGGSQAVTKESPTDLGAPDCAPAVAFTNVGTVVVQGGDCTSAELFGLTYSAHGGHGSLTGLNGADASLSSIDLLGVKFTQSESCPNGCTFGENVSSLHSVHTVFQLGRTDFGRHRPHLTLFGSSLSASLASPAALIPSLPDPNMDVVILPDSTDPRQIRLPQGLVDISSVSSNHYCAYFYAVSSLANGGEKALDGLYHTNGMPALSVYDVCNPVPANTNCLRIAQTNDTGTIAHQYDYYPLSGGSNIWQLSAGNGLRVEQRFCVTNTDSRSETYSMMTGTNGPVVQQSTDTYRSLAFGEALVQRQLDPNGAALTAVYTYYTNAADNGYGKLRQSTFPGGSWQILEYDGSGRPLHLYFAFGNQPPTTNSALCRMIEYSYNTNSGSGDIGAYRPQLPRREIEFLLGHEVVRKYYVYKSGEKQERLCQTVGAAWNATDNLVTITKRFTTESNKYELENVTAPDGTMTLYQYTTNVLGTLLTNTVSVGQTDLNGTSIVDGTRAVTVKGLSGEVFSEHVYDIATGLLKNREIYSDFDDRMRPRRIDHLDGTFETITYGCCGLESTTDRDGVTTNIEYDALKRRERESRLGVITHYYYDAANRVIGTTRSTNGVDEVWVKQVGYDRAGRLIAETNALGVVTRYNEEIDAQGQTVRITTYAAGTSDEATRVETYALDGSLLRVDGTAVSPIRFEYNVEEDGDGVYFRSRKEIKLNSDGSDSSEWTKSYTDAAGRLYKTTYSGAGAASTQSYFNSKGQAYKEIDPDGVVTLRQHNARGELEYTAVDLNQNGVIDFGGNDRIIQRILDVFTNATYGVSLERLRTLAWPTNGVDASNIVSTVETSVDGLQSWTATSGVTNRTRTQYPGGGIRLLTTTFPDGSTVQDTYASGQLATSIRYDNTGGQVFGQTFAYDAWGRKAQAIDARNGTTQYFYDDLDRVTTAVSPPDGMGGAPQIVGTQYDNLGRVHVVIEPDGLSVTNEYTTSGLLERTYGARRYPVSYTYDCQGRLKTMVTWKDFPAGASNVTTWTYNPNRGWLDNKRYSDNLGPDYEYTTAGRLHKRIWARGSPRIATVYGYTSGGDLNLIDYSDATPDVSFQFDRQGRRVSNTANGITTTVYFDINGLPRGESYIGGLLTGLNVTNIYDSFIRRETLSVRNGSIALGNTIVFGYDSASRLQSVDDGTYSATYDYITNSKWWEVLTFKAGSTLRATTVRQFDNLDRVRWISTSSAGAASLKFDYGYNALGQRTHRTDSDGSYWVYQYDSLGQVTSGRRYWRDGTAVAGQQFDYEFDDIGNRETTGQGGTADGANLRSAIYGPNGCNQYTNRTVPSAVDIVGLASAFGSVTVNGTAAYRRGEYFWNQLSVSNAAGPAWIASTVLASVGSTNNTAITGNIRTPPSSEALGYDSDGNLTQDGLWIYSWDAENRLVSVQSCTNIASAARRKVSWEFDSMGRRIRQVSAAWDGATYTNISDLKLLYDGWQCIAELLPNNSLARAYAWGLDLGGSIGSAGGVGGILWMRPLDGAAHFAVMDGNGNVAGLVDGSSGTFSARYEYDPFGNIIRMTGTGTIAKDNPFRFSTKRTDETTDLVLYEYRPYSPTLGRWPTGIRSGRRGD